MHDANVVAEPDPYLGERTRAYVILRADAEPVGPLAVQKFVRARGLAAYKVPDHVEFVGAFPQTGVGKISKNELRDDAARPPGPPAAAPHDDAPQETDRHNTAPHDTAHSSDL